MGEKPSRPLLFPANRTPLITLIINKLDQLYKSRCFAQRQGGKTSAMIFEKQLVVAINLRRVIRPFPNDLKSIILQ